MPEARPQDEQDGTSHERRWYVLKIKPQHEFRVEELIGGRFERYLPLYPEQSRRLDRFRTLQKPLFPGYLFVRFAYDLPLERNAVLSLPGVLDILRFRSEFGYLEPVAVSEQEMEQVRALVSMEAQPVCRVFQTGDLVSVPVGYAIMPGVVARIDGELRAIVTVEMLGRQVSVPVRFEQMRKVA